MTHVCAMLKHCPLPKTERGQKNYSIVFVSEGFLSFMTTFKPI